MIKEKALWNINCRNLCPVISKQGSPGWSVAWEEVSSGIGKHADVAFLFCCIPLFIVRRKITSQRSPFPGKRGHLITDTAIVT